MKLLVIADDFTGALDTGIQFSSFGIEVYVLFELKRVEVPGNTVLIYDAETRHKTPEKAYAMIREIVQWARENEITGIYKKTDSALRGNVGIELQALLDHWEDKTLIFAPAYPEMNRITKNGIQFIDGIPVAESPFGRDLFEPVRHSSVADIIHETSSIQTRESQGAVWNQAKESREILIADAETCADLDEIARWSIRHRIRSYAGCAGFARALAKNIFRGGQRTAFGKLSPYLLAVCGSIHPATVRQVETAVRNGMERISISQKKLMDSGYLKGQGIHADAAAWAAVCRKTGGLILNVEEGSSEKSGSSREFAMGEKIAAGLASAAKGILDTGLLPTLFCTGGDTLRAVIRQMEITILQPIAELYPGVVLSRGFSGNVPIHIISKSGGFGPPDLLLRIKQLLQQSQKTEMEKSNEK